MSLDALRQELRKKTQSEVLRIENEGKIESKKIKDESKRQSEIRREARLKEAAELVGREEMRIPAARLKAKRIVQDAKYGMVEKALDEATDLLMEKTKSRKEYEKLLEQLISQGLKQVGDKNSTILVRKADLQFARKFGKCEEYDCMGGAIIVSSEGRIRINNTLEALLEKNKELLLEKAFEMMFGKAK